MASAVTSVMRLIDVTVRNAFQFQETLIERIITTLS